MSRDMGIDAQEIWQMFYLERILERVSRSPYKENFIKSMNIYQMDDLEVDSEGTRFKEER
jgi:hypothetical protein